MQGVQRGPDSAPNLKELRSNCAKCTMVRQITELCPLIQKEPSAWPGEWGDGPTEGLLKQRHNSGKSLKERESFHVAGQKSLGEAAGSPGGEVGL